MHTLTALKSEISRILHNRKLLIAIIGVMTIPLLYSGTYLWAFWNPYGHLDRLPVAVVNNDQGAKYNGEKLEIGKDLVKKLKEKKSFNWKFVTENEADTGLENQDYYIKIEIPKDFSENATTLQSAEPKKLNLIYTPNEGYNYLTAKIGDSAIEKIKEEVSSAVTKTYAESMFDNIKDVAKGLNKAADGAGELSSGIDSAKSGSRDLQAGIATAKNGASSVNDGANQVNSGTKKLEENLKTLAEKSVSFSNGTESAQTGSQQLQAGLNQFGTGLTQMQTGANDLLAGSQKTKAGAQKLSAGIDEAKANMPDLQAGSEQIKDAAGLLSTSIDTWNSKAGQASDGAQTVSDGLQQAAAFVSQMAAGTSDTTQKAQLAGLVKKLNDLADGSKEVASGVNGLATGAGGLQKLADGISNGAGQLNAGQDKLANGINDLSVGANDLVKGETQVNSGLQTFNNKIDLAMKGFGQLTAGSSKLTSGLNQLAAGSVQFKDGTSKLAQGSQQLTVGTNQLSAGTQSLSSGMSKLANGSSDLTGGMNQLSSGSKELKDQLANGAKDSSNVKADNSVYDMFAKPVSLKDTRLNHVPDYGTGFAPYFLSLSLFVGALVLSVIFPMFEPAEEPKSGLSWFASKLGILLAVGLAQALLADVVLLKGLGLEVKSVPYFVMMSIFASWTFFAIIQFLVTVLDNPGRFIAIIILVLQLTSSAGTYPIELSPKFLQNIAHFMPMSYTVSGFRAIISTGDFHFMWKDIGFISIFFIVFLCATMLFFVMKYKKQSRLLQPEMA